MRRNLPRPFSRRSMEKNFCSICNSFDSMMLSISKARILARSATKMEAKNSRLTVAAAGLRWLPIHDCEIGLAFENIDPRHHYLEQIADCELPLRLPPKQPPPRSIKNVEVVSERRDMDQPGKQHIG